MNQIVEFLLENACPSIKYRVKKEVLNEISLYEEEYLQNQILEDRLVKEFLEKQNTDGWIDEDFHSEKGVETAIRLFFEKGVLHNQSSILRMINELERREEIFDKGCLSNVGKILDKKGFGGSQLIRATSLSYAGLENRTFIKSEIECSLDKFKFVLTVDKIADIAEQYKNKLVFKDNVKWPSIYDLRLLAFTKEWRNDENYKIIVDSIKQLVRLSPIPDILVLERNQLVAPASFCMHNFNPCIDTFEDKDWMMWFHRMELLSRLGVVNHIKELKEQVNFLSKNLKENNGLFKKKMNHYYLTKWGTYIGLALEKDWRSQNRRICDLTFRSLLILYYSEL